MKDTRRYIIDEFGLPDDVNFNKVQRLSYQEIQNLLEKYITSDLVSDEEINEASKKYHYLKGGYHPDFANGAKWMRSLMNKNVKR